MHAETLSNSMTPKVLRETLCVAQSALAALASRADHPSTVEGYRAHIARLGTLIREIDVVRPLGPDGRHGDRHTGMCGCPGRVNTWTLTP